MNIKVKKLDKSRVEITGELPVEQFESFRKEATKNLSEKVSVDGFRSGKVPENILKEKVGDMAILDEMAHLAISKSYPDILKAENIDAIGHPQVSITKLAANNPLGFTIVTAVLPPIELPDYKNIAKKVYGQEEKVEVADKEVEDATLELRKMRARYTASQGLKEGDKLPEIDEKNLPPLDEAYLKELGNFKDVQEFKDKLRESLKREKEQKAEEKKRIDTIEEIIKKSKLEVPELLVEYELEKMFAQMEHDVVRGGLKFDEYLKKIGKTKADLQKEWHESAEKRSKMQLILNKISAVEKLEPSEAELTAEVQKLKEYFKKTGEDKNFSEPNARAYVASVLVNQKVFEFLEKQK